MRLFKILAAAAFCLLALSLVASAGQNKFGVADLRNISFSEPIHVGDTLLPVGDYEVQHTMQGEDHIMVFKQLNHKKPAEARVKCQLVPLTAKAAQDQKIYTLNPAGERVLQALIFRGDKAEHRF
jgi:hypothetical protein